MAKYTYEITAKPASYDRVIRKGTLSASGIQEARAKAARIVKANEWIHIYKDGGFEGTIYLTWRGTAVFVKGYRAWYCSPQGAISNPEYYE